jgi:hypothetical protein
MDGYRMDKKAMRFSAMADYMDHVAAIGGMAIDGLGDAVSTAILVDGMNIQGTPFDRAPYRWMEVLP